MRHLKTFLTVIGAVTILVLAANSAVYAATGGKFILGKTNKANKVSTLKRTTSGAALNLVTKSSSNAPLTTNGKGKVTNLNADSLDGKDSSAFAANNPTKVYKYTAATPATSHSFSIPIPAAGTYLVTYSVPMTLAGTTTQSEWGYCEVGQSDALIFGTYQGSGHAATASAIGTGPSAGPTMGVSATTVISPGSLGFSFNVFCNASANWTTPPQTSFFGTNLAQPAIITLTKISNVAVTSSNARVVSPSQQNAMKGRMDAVR
jgi:hypothetical protein